MGDNNLERLFFGPNGYELLPSKKKYTQEVLTDFKTLLKFGHIRDAVMLGANHDISIELYHDELVDLSNDCLKNYELHKDKLYLYTAIDYLFLAQEKNKIDQINITHSKRGMIINRGVDIAGRVAYICMMFSACLNHLSKNKNEFFWDYAKEWFSQPDIDEDKNDYSTEEFAEAYDNYNHVGLIKQVYTYIKDGDSGSNNSEESRSLRLTNYIYAYMNAQAASQKYKDKSLEDKSRAKFEEFAKQMLAKGYFNLARKALSWVSKDSVERLEEILNAKTR
jgi:hypothetical protein